MLNRFWRNTRHEKHHPDPPAELAPDVAPASGSGDRAAGRGCTCEFCECRLTASGEVLRLGAKAKGFREHETTVEALKKQIDELTKERDILKAASAAIDPKKKEYRIG